MMPVDPVSPPTRSHLFTVRVWQEDLGDGKIEWRGQVQHVLSGESCYFREWDTLVAFLRETIDSDRNDVLERFWND